MGRLSDMLPFVHPTVKYQLSPYCMWGCFKPMYSALGQGTWKGTAALSFIDPVLPESVADHVCT